MGFVTLGIFVFNVHGIEGALLQMINHGVTTGALFILVGMIYERTHSRDLAMAAGVGKFMPIYVTFLGFFSLSSLAFPGTNSFIGEFLVLVGAFSKSKIIAACAIPGAFWRQLTCCVCCRKWSGVERIIRISPIWQM